MLMRFNKGTWVEDGVASDLGGITEDSAKFAHTGIDETIECFDADGLGVESEVGQDDTCAEVAVVAENGISNVVKMWRLDVVQEQAILKFATVAENTTFTDNHVLPNVDARSQLAPLPNVRRTLDCSKVRQLHPSFKKNLFPNK